METIILLPGVLACMVLARRSVPQTLLAVYLPVLMLLPLYFVLRVQHLPPLTFTDTAILPVGVAMAALLLRSAVRWELRRLDLWILLFILSAGISESLRTNSHTGGLVVVSGLTTAVLPYMAGRLLIEPYGLREVAVRRFLFLLAAVAVWNIYDFGFGISTTQIFWRHFFPDQPIEWPQQVRWGLGRIAGPYAQSILCGMMFLVGLIWCMWLRRARPAWERRRIVGFLPVNLRTLLLVAMIAGLAMTQSRGPWLGAILAVAIVWVGRQQQTRRAAWKVAGAALAVLVLTWGMADRYTAGTERDAKNLEQQNAIYRRELIGHYIPVVLKQPLLGWGTTDYPKIAGQTSIDNEYLLLAVTQGFVGLGLFLAINFESGRSLLRAMQGMTEPADRAFVFSLMGILGGLLATFTTVYLGMQVHQLFFLLTGWIQALRPSAVATVSVEQAFRTPAKFEFRNVLG